MMGKIIVWMVVAVGLAALLSLPFWPPSIFEALEAVPDIFGLVVDLLTGGSGAIGKAPLGPEDAVRQFMQIFLSVAVGIASLIVILGKNYKPQREWAFGAMGTLLGYWLR
jgi:hypothetical protein